MTPQNLPTFLEGKIRFAELAQRTGPLIQIRVEEYLLLLRLAKCAALFDDADLKGERVTSAGEVTFRAITYRVEALREFYTASIPVPEGKEL